MKSPFQTPEQLLPYRTARQVLETKPAGTLSVSPDTTVFACLQLMATKGVGFLAVIERDRLVGVFSERDYARKVELVGKASKETPVREIMASKVVSVTPEQTVAQCMALMDEKGFRHLPVVEGEKVVGVLSIRDLMKEVIGHHERLIREMELQKIAMTTDSSSY